MKKNLFLIAVLSVFIYASFFASCGGGGGGGGGASIPSDEYSTHNPSGWGGDGGTASGGSSGTSTGGNTSVVISGTTPLTVSSYTFNGTQYTDVEELIRAIKSSGRTGTFYVPFVVNGETRQARVTMSGNQCTFEHEYRATATVNGTTVTIPFYKNDGITLSQIAAAMPAETVGTGASAVTFEVQKINIGGVEYPTNGTIPASAISGNGDVTISSTSPVYNKWGISQNKTIQFSSSLNNGDAIAISTTEPISGIQLPGGGKVVKLDLSNMAKENPSVFDGNFISPISLVSELIVPNGVQTIASNTFNSAAARLKSVTLPDSVTIIETKAFLGNTTLESVNLPEGLTTLDTMAFDGCSALRSITIPSTLETIGEQTFRGCTSLQTLTIQNGVKHIEGVAFSNCTALTSVVIPDSVETIDAAAFHCCQGLENVTLPINSAFTELATNIFYGCSSLSSISIPSSVTTINENAFFDCVKLNGISIPSSVSTIGQSAFENCFKDSSLQNGVTVNFYSNPTLGVDAFKNCTYLKNICGRTDSFTMDASGNKFAGCTNLSYLNLTSCTNISVYASMFASTTQNVTIDLALNNINLSFNDDATFSGTQPLFVIGNANYFNNLTVSNVDISTCTWGGKGIYVKMNVGADAGYYQFNASGANGFAKVAEISSQWPTGVIP